MIASCNRSLSSHIQILNHHSSIYSSRQQLWMAATRSIRSTFCRRRASIVWCPLPAGVSNISSKEFYTLPMPRSLSNMERAPSGIVAHEPIFGSNRSSQGILDASILRQVKAVVAAQSTLKANS